MPETLQWKALEHEHRERDSDWFWALAIVAVSSALVAVLFKNILFAVLILVGSFTMALLAKRPPSERTFTLTKRGVMIDGSLYPYQMLAAFNVVEHEGQPTLIIDARRFMVPHIIAPLEEGAIDSEQVRTYLQKYLPEVDELDEPMLQRLVERFGF